MACRLSDLELGDREDAEAALIASVFSARQDGWLEHELGEIVFATARLLSVALTEREAADVLRLAGA